MEITQQTLDNISEKGLKIANEIDDGAGPVSYTDWVLARMICFASDPTHLNDTHDLPTFHPPEEYAEEMAERCPVLADHVLLADGTKRPLKAATVDAAIGEAKHLPDVPD